LCKALCSISSEGREAKEGGKEKGRKVKTKYFPKKILGLSQFVCFLFVDWGLNSGLCTCKAATLPLDPHLQSILLWLFWRWSFLNYWPRLALNLDPAYLNLPSS
jgi:hypothetical protein